MLTERSKDGNPGPTHWPTDNPEQWQEKISDAPQFEPGEASDSGSGDARVAAEEALGNYRSGDLGEGGTPWGGAEDETAAPRLRD